MELTTYAAQAPDTLDLAERLPSDELQETRRAAGRRNAMGAVTDVRRSRVAGIVGLVVLAAALSEAAAGGAVLVKNARIACATVVTDEPRARTTGDYAVTRKHGSYVEIALEELKEHLGLVAQGEIETLNAKAAEADRIVREQAAAGRSAVLLGGVELDADLAKAIRQAQRDASDPDSESFALEVTDGVVKIVGLTPKGMLNGVYELLEQIGFRWYMPGSIGRVVPHAKTLGIADQRSIGVPSFRGRQLRVNQFGDVWGRRMRNSVWTVHRRHGIRPLHHSGLRRKWFPKHPEHFALRNGKRVPGQLCVSNPEVLRMAIDAAREYLRANPDAEFYGMGPNDGSGFCECAECRALDSGELTPFTHRPSVTDRYFWFFNQLIKALEAEFPNVKIGTLVYSDTMMPPVKVKPDPRIVGCVALIHLCRIHSPRNPVCPESHTYEWICRRWHEAGVRVDNSGYWFNLADPGLPFMMIHRIRDEIPLAYEFNHLGFARACATQWANEGPSLYLAAKLMWDHKTDVDALLKEFFTKFYGPAAGPMERYTMLINDALRDADHHTGGSWDLLHIYGDAVRKAARKALGEARQLAGEGLHGTRVRVASEGWDYFEAFAETLERRRRHDYAGSKAALERARGLVEHLSTAYDIPMLRTQAKSVSAARFLERFGARATDEAHPRVTGGNTLVAGLDETWDFMQDPQALGETIGLYREEIKGGNWRKISTSSSWGNQGLRYYFGEAWYRQDVEIPRKYAGKKIMLWFASVDDAAKVWVNGELLGISPGAVFDIDAHGGSTRPFEFDATEALRLGERNVMAVRVRRNKVNELGTGGIMGPVMFYAPAE